MFFSRLTHIMKMKKKKKKVICMVAKPCTVIFFFRQFFMIEKCLEIKMRPLADGYQNV